MGGNSQFTTAHAKMRKGGGAGRSKSVWKRTEKEKKELTCKRARELVFSLES